MIFNKKKKQTTETLLSPLRGRVIPLCEVNDPAFSEKILGDGCAIIPESGVLTAPADGVIDSVPDTHHAIMMRSDSGAEILMHIGIDTVRLNGEHFRPFVRSGEKVHAGDILIEFDLLAIKNIGYDTVTPIVISNHEIYENIRTTVDHAVVKEPFMELKRK